MTTIKEARNTETVDISNVSTFVPPNTSGFHPFEYNVLVTCEEKEEKTQGGVYLPEQTRDREEHASMEATIIELSDAAFTYHEWDEGVRLPKAGDRVLFTRYGGSILDGKDGRKYRIVKDKDIAAIID